MNKKTLGYILILISAVCTAVNFSPMVEQAEAVPGSLMSTHPLLYWPLTIGIFGGGGGFTVWMLVEVVGKEKGNARKFWALVILVLSWIGAAIYFIMKYSKKRMALERIGSAPIDIDKVE